MLATGAGAVWRGGILAAVRALQSNPGRTAKEKLVRINDQNNLACILGEHAREPEAESLLRDVAGMPRAVAGDDHPLVPFLLANLARIQDARGRFADCERAAREALVVHRRLHGEKHPESWSTMGVLGSALMHQGRLDEAEAILRPRLEAVRQAFGEDSVTFIAAAATLADLCVRKRDLWGEAEALLGRALKNARRLGAAHEAGIHDTLGRLYMEMGRFQEAERELQIAEELYEKNPTIGPDRRIEVKTGLANLYERMGSPVQALDKSREALQLCEQRYGEEHAITFRVLESLAIALTSAGRHDEAEAVWARLIPLGRRVLGPESIQVITYQM